MRWGLGALARRPILWAEAVRAFIALSPRRWWRRFPFLPRVDHRYLAWRIATAYGTEEATLTDDDMIRFLEWRRLQRRAE